MKGTGQTDGQIKEPREKIGYRVAAYLTVNVFFLPPGL